MQSVLHVSLLTPRCGCFWYEQVVRTCVRDWLFHCVPPQRASFISFALITGKYRKCGRILSPNMWVLRGVLKVIPLTTSRGPYGSYLFVCSPLCACVVATVWLHFSRYVVIGLLKFCDGTRWSGIHSQATRGECLCLGILSGVSCRTLWLASVQAANNGNWVWAGVFGDGARWYWTLNVDLQVKTFAEASRCSRPHLFSAVVWQMLWADQSLSFRITSWRNVSSGFLKGPNDRLQCYSRHSGHGFALTQWTVVPIAS